MLSVCTLDVILLFSVFRRLRIYVSELDIRTFIRHKDRQYKTETGTDRIKKDLKSIWLIVLGLRLAKAFIAFLIKRRYYLHLYLIPILIII